MSEIFTTFLQSFLAFLPQVLWAILIFLIGWFTAKIVGKIVDVFLDKLGLNHLFKRMGWQEALTKIDVHIPVSKIFGELVRWFVIIFFLMACTEIVGLVQFSQFLEKVVGYFHNIFIAALIFIVAVFLVDFSKKIVIGTLEKEKIIYSRFLGKGISWAIWILVILAILYQLNIVPTLILVIFIGVTAMITLAVGIAFGLGGKDLASKILKELEEKFK